MQQMKIKPNKTVLSGTLHAGRGDTVDKAKSKALPAGSYSVVPGKAHHYVWTTGETDSK
ncbi:MAG: hypothetical protein J0H47_05195 [Gammaproteobacteria bacterium]|nr:hypothetical protein [Gammaproteobacteria bacterium]